jgi:hypothetical protein
MAEADTAVKANAAAKVAAKGVSLKVMESPKKMKSHNENGSDEMKTTLALHHQAPANGKACSTKLACKAAPKGKMSSLKS